MIARQDSMKTNPYKAVIAYNVYILVSSVPVNMNVLNVLMKKTDLPLKMDANVSQDTLKMKKKFVKVI